MSASHLPALRVTALQAAACLARYERHVRRLATTWLDMDLYLTVSREVDEIRLICGALPQVAVPWTALLISHADLVHALWRTGQREGVPAPGDAGLRLEEHLACIDSLARRCLQVANGLAPDLPPIH
jgi:hypothetical protein